MAKEKVKLSPFVDALYRKSLGRLPKANTTHWKIQLSCKTQSSYCSVTKSYLTLCNPMDCSTSGFPVLYYLQARILRVGCHAFLQGIFQPLGLNLSFLHLQHWQVGILPLIIPLYITIIF